MRAVALFTVVISSYHFPSVVCKPKHSFSLVETKDGDSNDNRGGDFHNIYPFIHNPNSTSTQLKSWVWQENDSNPPTTTTETQCQQYLSCYWPDFNQTLNLGSWDEQQQQQQQLQQPQQQEQHLQQTNNNNIKNILSINDLILT